MKQRATVPAVLVQWVCVATPALLLLFFAAPEWAFQLGVVVAAAVLLGGIHTVGTQSRPPTDSP
jgi:hypothetical protein